MNYYLPLLVPISLLLITFILLYKGYRANGNLMLCFGVITAMAAVVSTLCVASLYIGS